MPARAARIVLALGLVTNAGLLPHPLGLAGAQVILALVVLTGWGGTLPLALAALALIPAPVAELRRSLSHVPLACACQRTTGHAGLWPIVLAAVDVALVGLTVGLARTSVTTPTGSAPKG